MLVLKKVPNCPARGAQAKQRQRKDQTRSNSGTESQRVRQGCRMVGLPLVNFKSLKFTIGEET